MKVFISWSGEPSRTIAREMSTWLSKIVQAVEPWMSDEEIGSGKRWRDEIGTALNETDFGIVCVTASNQHAPWLVFESGALAKHLEFARVIPLCIDLETTDVSGPLADWQARKLDREGVQRVVVDINAATSKPLSKEALSTLFDLMWPGLEMAINAAREAAHEPQLPQRPPRDLLEELLDRVRRMERDGRSVVVNSRFDITTPGDITAEEFAEHLRRILLDSQRGMLEIARKVNSSEADPLTINMVVHSHELRAKAENEPNQPEASP